MDRQDFLESKRRFEEAMGLFETVKQHLPMTHLQSLTRLQNDLARIIVFRVEDVMAELEDDELALPRRLNLIREIRDQARADLLVHQLTLAGMKEVDITDGGVIEMGEGA